VVRSAHVSDLINCPHRHRQSSFREWEAAVRREGDSRRSGVLRDEHDQV